MSTKLALVFIIVYLDGAAGTYIILKKLVPIFITICLDDVADAYNMLTRKYKLFLIKNIQSNNFVYFF